MGLVPGSGFRVPGSEFGVPGSGAGLGSGFRVRGSFGVPGSPSALAPSGWSTSRSGAGAWVGPDSRMSTTIPVSVRLPSGTRTRAPMTGIGRDSGTLYVRASSVGTGTATAMRRIGAYSAGPDGTDDGEGT